MTVLITHEFVGLDKNKRVRLGPSDADVLVVRNLGASRVAYYPEQLDDAVNSASFEDVSAAGQERNAGTELLDVDDEVTLTGIHVFFSQPTAEQILDNPGGGSRLYLERRR